MHVKNTYSDVGPHLPGSNELIVVLFNSVSLRPSNLGPRVSRIPGHWAWMLPRGFLGALFQLSSTPHPRGQMSSRLFSQIPKYTSPIPHSTPFTTEVCIFPFRMVHRRIWGRCIVLFCFLFLFFKSVSCYYIVSTNQWASCIDYTMAARGTPADTWRNHNVLITSKRRRDVVLT